MIAHAQVLDAIRPLPGEPTTVGHKQLVRLGDLVITAQLVPTIRSEVYSGIRVRVLSGPTEVDVNVFDFAAYNTFRPSTGPCTPETVIDTYTQNHLHDPGYLTPQTLREAINAYLAIFT